MNNLYSKCCKRSAASSCASKERNKLMKQFVNVCVKVWHEAKNKLCIQIDDEV